MPNLTEIAYAKINLALHVRARRADGYHMLETLFAFAQDGDVLTAEPAETISLTLSGPFAKGLSTGPDNLVIRAAEALRATNGFTTGAALHLEKNLPVAAGIGGGSADAAAALRLLARLWRLDESAVQPIDIATPLGADVPACIASVTCFGTGVGDELSPVESSALSALPLLLVNPLVPCPTGPVFKAWDGVDRGPLVPEAWMTARNDLEAPAKALVPEIAPLLERMRTLPGVRLARMSGSGATCFALFESIAKRDQASGLFPDHWVMASRLR